MDTAINEARIGLTAPPLAVDAWLQGDPTSLSDLVDRVVLVAVFQVNCPGCFLHCLPRVEGLHRRYREQGLTVLGLATAFEDFEKNTVANLRLLLEEGRVIGETEKLLSQYGLLERGTWPYRLSFPVAMDHLTPRETDGTAAEVERFIEQRIDDFQARAPAEQHALRAHLRDYFSRQPFRPESFERYQLQGTPSYLLIDRNGHLVASRFGAYETLEADLIALL
ncbi:TlpA family protein disulfide reductase [Methylomonas sp. MED-D]|uniref:TlpA family protein disulfide reductase n=1 Tax=Methylomonas sp. MED-D TaxID=3418768 RepID=UPI003D06E561